MNFKIRQLTGQLTHEIPLVFEKPIYGELNSEFMELIAPGFLLTTAFFSAMSWTALILVVERKEGILERTLIAGISLAEYLLSHIITQLVVLFVQTVLMLTVALAIFRIPHFGSLFTLTLLTYLQGISGLTYGLLISSLSGDENLSVLLSVGTLFVSLFVSGTFWPIEAMPRFFQALGNFLPQTLPIKTMRFIMYRGWGFDKWDVNVGFIVTVFWIIIFLLFAIVIMKIKK